MQRGGIPSLCLFGISIAKLPARRLWNDYPSVIRVNQRGRAYEKNNKESAVSLYGSIG
jgi:hypothetical protein